MALTATLLSTPRTRGSFYGLPTSLNAWVHSSYIMLALKYIRAVGSYTERWKITGATSATTILDVLGATNLPVPGTRVSQDLPYVYSQVDIEDTDAISTWYATVTVEIDPCRLPTVVNLSADHVQEAVWKYFDKEDGFKRKPITNSVGDLLSPPVVDARGKGRIEVITRKPYFNVESIGEFVHHQNVAKFPSESMGMGFGPGIVYCSDLRAHYQDRPVSHYVINAVFQIDMKGWAHEPINASYYHLEDATAGGGKLRVRNKDDRGVWYKTQRMITQDGTEITVDPTTYELSAEPHYLKFDTVPYADFNALKLFTRPD